jgi:hypothetical protein
MRESDQEAIMKKLIALFILFTVSAVHAECITKYGMEYCIKETPPPRCITSDGKEFCQKDSPSVAVPTIQLPQTVYVPQLYPPVYYGYPYYYGGPAVVFRFGGNHHRH